MFKINYRITNSIDQLSSLSLQELGEGDYIEGFFKVEVNNKYYGYFKDGPLEVGESGFEWITIWLEGLLKTLVALKTGYQYVALSDIDSYNSFLEFKLLDNNAEVSVSIIYAEKKEGSGLIETRPPKDIIYGEWTHEIVLLDEIFLEVVNKATTYLQEIGKINRELANSPTMTQLKNLIQSLKYLYKEI